MTSFAERYAAPLRLVAWVAAGASVALWIVIVVSATQTPRPFLNASWPSVFAIMAVVGALIAVRRPDNLLGWLFIAAGVLMLTNGFGTAYTAYALAHHTHPPFIRIAGWFRFWSWMPSVALTGVILAVFPTGRPLNAFWRWVVRLSVPACILSLIGALLILGAPARQLYGTSASIPSDVRGGSLLEWLSGPIPVFIVLGFIALVHRFVGARGIERIQLKWFTYGTAILALGIAIFYLTPGPDPIDTPLASISVSIGIAAIPITAAIAILRYRLYDIDRLISRTVSYALVTAVLLGTFAVLAILPGFVLFSGRHTPDWLVAAATLLVVALARPVLRSVRSFVDKRFDRSRYDAAATIETFGSRLRDDIDMESLLAEIETTVRRTMNPTHVSLWLR